MTSFQPENFDRVAFRQFFRLVFYTDFLRYLVDAPTFYSIVKLCLVMSMFCLFSFSSLPAFSRCLISAHERSPELPGPAGTQTCQPAPRRVAAEGATGSVQCEERDPLCHPRLPSRHHHRTHGLWQNYPGNYLNIERQKRPFYTVIRAQFKVPSKCYSEAATVVLCAKYC